MRKLKINVDYWSTEEHEHQCKLKDQQIEGEKKRQKMPNQTTHWHIHKQNYSSLTYLTTFGTIKTTFAREAPAIE